MGFKKKLGRCRADRQTQEIIGAKIMAEYSTVTRLLEKLRSEFELSRQSPRGLILDQSIYLCGAYLETLMNEERHTHLAQSAHRNARNLKRELETSIALLDDHQQPDRRSRDVSQPTRPNNVPNKKTGCSEISEPNVTEGNHKPTLKIYFFGAFKVYLNEKEMLIWPKTKSKQLFKYLASKGKTAVPKEVLMELFWPNHSSESGRNNLNVAIYSLRQSLKELLPDTSVILFREGCYQINPEIKIWVDANQFSAHLRQASRFELHGETKRCIAQLQKAEKLYIGPLLSEDSYCDWVVELQNQAKEEYRSALLKLEYFYRQSGNLEASIELNKKLIAMDTCDENAHQRLMESYSFLGQRHLALQQFKVCEESLKRDLDLYPQKDLIDLYEQIRSMKFA